MRPPEKRTGPVATNNRTPNNITHAQNVRWTQINITIKSAQECVEADNVRHFPDIRTEPAMPDECQALWRDAVAKHEMADVAMRRFQNAFLDMSAGKGGAA